MPPIPLSFHFRALKPLKLFQNRKILTFLELKKNKYRFMCLIIKNTFFQCLSIVLRKYANFINCIIQFSEPNISFVFSCLLYSFSNSSFILSLVGRGIKVLISEAISDISICETICEHNTCQKNVKSENLFAK